MIGTHIQRAVRLTLLPLAASAWTGCNTSEAASRHALVTTLDTAIATTSDSTSDTLVYVRNAGGTALPPHTLQPLLRIAISAGGGARVASADHLTPRADGGVYVWSGQAGSLSHFNARGEFVRQIGRLGGGLGEYEGVSGLLVVDDHLVVWDPIVHQASVYDSAGVFRTAWAPARTASADGRLRHRGSNSFYLRQPLSSVAGDRGTSPEGFVAYRWDGSVIGDTVIIPEWTIEAQFTLQAMGPNGYVVRDHPFTPRFVFGLSPQGHLVSGNGRLYQLDVRRRSGLPLRIERAVTPVWATAGERTDSAVAATAEMKRINPDWTWHGPGISHQKPYFGRILFAGDGTVWVERAAASVLQPRVARSSGRQQPTVWREDLTYDLFDVTGRFVGWVSPPPRSHVLEIAGDIAWGVERDDRGVPSVVRWQIIPGAR